MAEHRSIYSATVTTIRVAKAEKSIITTYTLRLLEASFGMNICEKKLTTCADCLHDNHVVISEHCKSYYWKMYAQTSQKMGFGKDNATIAGLRKHILLIIETYTAGPFYSARVALELQIV